MIVTTQKNDINRFREAASRHLGFAFDEGKSDMLADALQQRLLANRPASLNAYLTSLESSSVTREELRGLAAQLTVTETYFFRNREHFHALEEIVLPDRIRARPPGSVLRILSAGCASGEEPHSIAIALLESGACAANEDVKVLGIDINPTAIDKAQVGRYSNWSLRQLPDEFRSRYFRAEGKEFVLDDRVRRWVTIEERNLIDDDAQFWRSNTFDIVFCRNVLMYFTPDAAQAVVERIARSITPGGFLFLGHAETLRGLSHSFHLCHTHETFYYRRREDDATHPRFDVPAVWTEDSTTSAPSETAAPQQPGETWFDTIRNASEKIALLARRSAVLVPAGDAFRPESVCAPRRSRGFVDAMEFLRQERFAEGLETLRSLPSESAGDPDVQLLHAVLLTQCGRLAEARQVAATLLALDDLSAGAHYLMALGCEDLRDIAAASQHDRTAAYLEPSFAMPHLHLGLLARRSGDLWTARRELARALALLAREDTSRILLFGGGFNRESLLELCRAELRACGGNP